jgi:flavin reductase (DIM6/NTAB) family NADH-FMN oxidoreductase RutF
MTSAGPVGDKGAAGAEEPAGFHAVTALLDYPMFVVTTATGGERSGCLVGFATQVSIHPPRFLVALSDKNHTTRVAQRATALAVHLLGRDQEELARLFGEETGDAVDKFARCAWRDGPDGTPVLDDAVACFGGPVRDRVALGDHVGFLVEPTWSEVRRAADPLLGFREARRLHPGHEA